MDKIISSLFITFMLYLPFYYFIIPLIHPFCAMMFNVLFILFFFTFAFFDPELEDSIYEERKRKEKIKDNRAHTARRNRGM